MKKDNQSTIEQGNEANTMLPTAAVELGKNYKVVHTRKGKFQMQITQITDEWITGIITKGKADAICSYNVGRKGDEITIRKTLSYFYPCK